MGAFLIATIFSQDIQNVLYFLMVINRDKDYGSHRYTHICHSDGSMVLLSFSASSLYPSFALCFYIYLSQFLWAALHLLSLTVSTPYHTMTSSRARMNLLLRNPPCLISCCPPSPTTHRCVRCPPPPTSRHLSHSLIFNSHWQSSSCPPQTQSLTILATANGLPLFITSIFTFLPELNPSRYVIVVTSYLSPEAPLLPIWADC